MLDEGEAERYSTAERWLYTGYALLDALGGRPARLMPEGEREQLLAGFARRDRMLLRLTDAAIRDTTDAIRLDPQNAGAYNNRALADDKLGINDRAMADREKAKALASKR